MLNPITENTLFYGDNLDILREYIPSESVDLIYLDPLFNFKPTYNVGGCAGQAAAWTGLHQPDISAMENGARKVDAIELFWFAALYGKPMEWFFGH